MNNNKQDQWDLTPIFASDDDPKIQQVLKKAESNVKKFVTKWKVRTDYLSDLNTLKEALDDYEAVYADTGLDGYVNQYFFLRKQTELNNTDLIKKSGKYEEVLLEHYNAIQFFELSLGACELAFQNKALGSEVLIDYRNYLTIIFDEAKYALSEAEERIFNLLSPNASDKWVSALKERFAQSKRTIELDGQQKQVGLSVLKQQLLSHDQDKRDRAVQHIYDIYSENSFLAEKEFNAFLEYHKVQKTIRSYPRVDTVALLRDSIEGDTMDALNAAVVDNFDIVHQYYKLKAEYVGKEVLQYHERVMPFYGPDELPDYTWDLIKSTVINVFEGVDNEFGTVVKDLINQRRVDVFPRQNKRGGGFCSYGTPNVPPYIFLNMEQSIPSVITFAHECGHALHHTYFHSAQNALNARGSLFTAEVSSKLMEAFSYNYLHDLYKDNPRLQFLILMSKVEGAINSVFRQISGYQFELEIHRMYAEEGYLSTKQIGEVFTKHAKAFGGDSVKINSGSENWWMAWPHLRRPFYVYSYASGSIISSAMFSKYNEDNAFLAKIKDFLKDGLYHSPREQFALMGLDVADTDFWKIGIAEIRKDLELLKTLV